MKLTFSELSKSLEAERIDISYRKQLSAPQVQLVTKTLKVIPERFKKIYFHAGRYAAGDRDSLAVEAWTAYEDEENL
jgi:hypothetical protein